MGAEILLRGVKLKPGSPMMLSKLGNVYILSLSGNPYAAAATFELFGRALLAKLCGDPSIAAEKAKAALAEEFGKGAGVPRFVRSRLEDGLLHVPSAHSSGQLYTFAHCNCLAEIPAGKGPTPAGTELNVYLL
jgi:molybdopterin molybdotransferase